MSVDLKACVFPASMAKQTDKFTVCVERITRHRIMLPALGTSYVDDAEGREWDAKDVAVAEAQHHSYGWDLLSVEYEPVSAIVMRENVGEDHE